MDEFIIKKSQKAKSLVDQKKWKKSMVEKLGLSEDVADTKAHQVINHAIHPCFCKGKHITQKYNKFRNKKDGKNTIDLSP